MERVKHFKFEQIFDAPIGQQNMGVWYPIPGLKARGRKRYVTKRRSGFWRRVSKWRERWIQDGGSKRGIKGAGPYRTRIQDNAGIVRTIDVDLPEQTPAPQLVYKFAVWEGQYCVQCADNIGR